MCKTEICWVTRGPRWGPGVRVLYIIHLNTKKVTCNFTDNDKFTNIAKNAIFRLLLL